MRKSKQVLLSAILLTAVTSLKAEAQMPANRMDNTDSTGHGTHGGGGGGHINPYVYTRNTTAAPTANHSSHPRTGGFGNTLRSMFSGS